MSLNGKEVTYGVAYIDQLLIGTTEVLESFKEALNPNSELILELTNDVDFLSKLLLHLQFLQENELKQ